MLAHYLEWHSRRAEPMLFAEEGLARLKNSPSVTVHDAHGLPGADSPGWPLPVRKGGIRDVAIAVPRTSSGLIRTPDRSEIAIKVEIPGAGGFVGKALTL